MENLKKFLEYKEKGTVLEGVVRITKFHDLLETNVLVVDLNGIQGIIPREEVDVIDTNKSLVNFVSKKIKFMVKEVDEEANLIICSRKMYKEIERAKIIERLECGETFKAKITKLLKFGAYVNIKGVTALLTNKDFTNDYIPIKDVKNVGDVVEVKLINVSKNNRIYVEADEKYECNTIMNFDIFEPQDVVAGVVKNITPSGCFVCIAPGLDALAPVPEALDIEVDMPVSFKIKQVNKPEDEVVKSGKKKAGVRGSIVRIINNEDVELD